VSALAYVAVVVATWLTGRRCEPRSFELAEPLRPVVGSVWDRLGMWAVVAVVLVAIAYAYPLLHLLSLERFGSPPISPL
jgi:hypothetical protein